MVLNIVSNAARAARFLVLPLIGALLLSQPVAAKPLRIGDKIAAALGGPFAALASSNENEGDSEYRALFLSWKKLDAMTRGVIAIPSANPVRAAATFSSGYGVRSDPFRGSAAMHAGMDLAAPSGTAIYATADGVVGRAEWSGGYGNLVEIEHGKGIQTRYGHLSRSLVRPGERVRRGQMIAMMGSTGRSTGNHLHYEVRIDGRAVNPVPFVQAEDYASALTERTAAAVARGGPDD